MSEPVNKVLFCATVDIHFKAFHLPYLEWFAEQNWEVHIAASGNLELPFVHKRYHIPIERSPFKLGNVRAYQQLKSIIEENHYQIIHCHTPLGGVLARLAARKARRKDGTRVIYTAHGFHFCKGTPFVNWMVYYPIEKGLAYLTDCLITINEEDYMRARRNNFHAGRIERVHGVGVNTERFRPVGVLDRLQYRQQYGYQPDEILLFYAGEFNHNKNQQLLIRALSRIGGIEPGIRLLLAGTGPLLQECREIAEQHDVVDRIDFLGFREDIASLLPMCDIAVSSSLREGLPVNIMEAMACGLPIVATRNRGHNELIADGVNGYIVLPDDEVELARKIEQLAGSPSLRRLMGSESLRRVERFSLENVSREMKNIYVQYGI